MAYLPESEADRQRRLAQEQGQQQGQQLTSGASGVITGGQPTSAQAPTMGKGPTRSGAFTNLNSYLQANKEQAAGLGQQVAGRIDQNAQQASTQIGQINTQFRQKADQSAVQRDQDFVKQAVANPTQAIKDPTNVQRFSRMRDAVYQGPQGLQDVDGYTDTYNQVQNTARDVENTKTEQGRFALVQDQFKKPSYQRGQQRLDQLLLQNSPEARQSIQSVQGKYGGIGDMLNQATTQSQAYAAQRKAETDAARQDVQQALGQYDDPTTPQNEAAGAFGNLQNSVTAKVSQQRSQAQNLYDRMNEQLKTGEFDQDVMDALGLKNGQQLYNVDMSQFGPSFNPDAFNAQTVADANDYAQAQALAQLAGQENSFLFDPKLAGTAKGPQVDQDRLKQNLDSAAKQYDQIWNDPMAKIWFMNSQIGDGSKGLNPNATPEELAANWEYLMKQPVTSDWGDMGRDKYYNLFKELNPTRRAKLKG